MKKLRLTNITFDEDYYFIYEDVKESGDNLAIEFDEDNFGGFLEAAAESTLKVLLSDGTAYLGGKVVGSDKDRLTVYVE